MGVKITDDFLETEGGERVQFSFGTDEKRSTDQSNNQRFVPSIGNIEKATYVYVSFKKLCEL